jgi:hypothetical protein
MPCSDAWQSAHGNGFFAVHIGKTARQSLCRALWALSCVSSLCRVSFLCCASYISPVRYSFAVRCGPLPCELALPCALALPCEYFVVRRCHPLPCARQQHARQRSCHVTTPRHPNVQVSSTWALCHVYAHGKVTKWSFAVCIHTAKCPEFFIFFCFSFNPCISKYEIHIYAYITSSTSNTSIYPQIHQTYQIDAYVHAYNIKHIK